MLIYSSSETDTGIKNNNEKGGQIWPEPEVTKEKRVKKKRE